MSWPMVIAARVLRAALTLALLAAVALALLRAAPGGPFDQERLAAPEVQAELERRYGLDQPFHRQYLDYLGNALRGDLGPSYHYVDRDVATLIGDGLAVTLPLAGLSLLLSLLLAGGLSALAVCGGHASDRIVRIAASVAAAMPKFALAPLLVLLFAVSLQWLPAAGLTAGWRSWILPVLSLTLPQAALLTRVFRAVWLQALSEDAVQSAGLRGISAARLIGVHALRLALPRTVGALIPVAIALFTGSAVVETVYALPGLGRLLVVAAQNRDYTLTLGLVLTVGAIVLAISLLADLLLRVLEPRMRR
jgi:oligopeptide transport system permease protein